MNPLKSNFPNVLASFGDDKFTTRDFIERLKSDYPDDWGEIVKKYGEGGKGSGNRFSGHSLVGQALKGLSDHGVLLCLEPVDAPPGWGNKYISAWKNASDVKNYTASAIDDLDDDIRNDDPEYLNRTSGIYVRDSGVRAQVLKRAEGKCEYCGEQGFLKRDGTPYLETHHIISLSEQGADKPHNVAALCATDHRKAHYSSNWAEMQTELLEKLAKFKTSKN